MKRNVLDDDDVAVAAVRGTIATPLREGHLLKKSVMER